MVYGKCGELVFESIPAMVIQSVALISSKRKSFFAVASLLISALSTALSATTIFYDVDVDPKSRKFNPKWLGIIPDQGRGKTFANVILLCTAHCLSKSLAYALLAVTNGNWLLGFIAADYGFFLAYMIARRDMIYFMPMPPTASRIIGPIFRIMQKAILDFTGSPSTRLPLLLGGRYYVFSLITTQAAIFAAVYLYDVGVPEGEKKLAVDTLWTGAAALCALWLALVAHFILRVATKSHRHTIWSSVTGRQCLQDRYWEAESDEIKLLNIFGSNRLLWEKELGHEVKKFTLGNWERWVEERPEWFDEQTIASVPDEYIPARFLGGLGGAAGRKRRGSAANSVAESIRHSFGEREEEEEAEK
jgi:hypothetical protein